MRHTPDLIAFCGLDGAGKSTQIDRLLSRLEEAGNPATYLWSRGGYTPLMNGVKRILRCLLGRRLPEAGRNESRSKALRNPLISRMWVAMAIVDLAILYGIYVRVMCLRGRTVVCDRYLADTYVDLRLNFPACQFTTWPLWQLLCWVTPKPGAMFLMLVPVEESIRRSSIKQEPFADTPEYLQARLDMYHALGEVTNWHCLDGCRSAEQVEGEVNDVLRGHVSPIEGV